MVGYIISAFIVLISGGLFFLLFKNPQGTFISYITKWEYRVLRRIRSEYLLGQKKKIPDSYDYFHNRAIAIIDMELKSHRDTLMSGESRFQKALEIIKMLNYPQFIQHFFTGPLGFTGKVFFSMYEDFRHGTYRTRDYISMEILKQAMPEPFKSENDRAFSAFYKLAEAGWFDTKTGRYNIVPGRYHYHIGRAIRMICKLNSIPAPEIIFSSFWGEDPKHVKDWLRGSRVDGENDIIDKDIERIIYS